jgi:drug/metabolite transporter (DMT)-like permease
MLTHIKLFLTALFWGGTFIAGRIVAKELDAYNAAFLRFLIAALLLLVIVLLFEKKLPPLKPALLFPVFLLGATGIFAYNVFFFKGLYHIHAGRASLIIATNPIFISLLSAIFFKEKLNILKIIGILLSVTGAIVVISNGRIQEIFRGHFGIGEVYISLCVLCWVSYSLIGKWVMRDLTPLISVFYSVVIGTVLLLGPALYHNLLPVMACMSLSAWIALAYLAFFGTVLGFIWYYQGIKAIGAIKSGLYINFVPVSAIILGSVILKEPVTLALLAGALLVIAGVYVTNFARRQKC